MRTSGRSPFLRKMITLFKINNSQIALKCDYAYRKRCREIGATFNYDKKYWAASLDKLPAIQTEFQGEIYYKTPLWKLLGQDQPEKQVMEYLGSEPSVPSLNLKPYPYQQDGIKFMIDRLNNLGFCLNGDSVGLGKTIQTIGTLKWFAEHGASKFIVICKKSIKYQWRDEIQRNWDFPVFITGQTKKKRIDAYNKMREAKKGILITNHHNFLNDFDEINRINCNIYVIDEAHCVKARNGKMNNLISATTNGKKTILLTGTPIMSKPDDIWGIVHLAQDYFGTYKRFKDRYLVTEFGIYGEQIVGARNLDELQMLMSQFLIMRSAEEVAIELPKQRPAKNIQCEMDSVQSKMQAIVEQRKKKQDIQKQDILDRHGYTEETREEIERLNELGKMYIATLQFIADDPAVFRFMNPEKGMNKQLKEMLPESYKMSSKTESLIDTVSELIDADEKAIIFCHFASTARMLQNQFEKIANANPVLFTGSESEDIRDSNIKAFKEDPECRVIIGTDAMAEGLNLQVSQHVIHFEQADTYAQREQRIGRARRIGSAFEYICVYDFITKNSFDETKINKLRNDYLITSAILNKK